MSTIPAETRAVTPAAIDRLQAEEFLYHEAALLDELRLDEWLELFTPDAYYWIPIDETRDPKYNASLIYDDPLRREERVYHLLSVPFPSQSPRSRTMHVVANVRVEPLSDQQVLVRSNQVVYELRSGDFRQTGLGEERAFTAYCEHTLDTTGDTLKIANKKIVLLNRDTSVSNLTFIF